jgi:hypothetical protein
VSATNVRPARGESGGLSAGSTRPGAGNRGPLPAATRGPSPLAAHRAAAAALAANERHVVHAQIVDEASGRPIARARYEIVRGGQPVARGTTGMDGLVYLEVPEAGDYSVRVLR